CIDITVRTELLGKRTFVLAARNGHGAIAALRGVLNRQVPETAYAEDRDRIAGTRSAVAQSIEGCDTGAEQRRGVCIVHLFGDESDGIRGSNNIVGIAAVVVDPGDWLVLAKNEIAFAT